MTNKEYKAAREYAETAPELYTFEKYNGYHASYYLDTNDKRDLRAEYKNKTNSIKLEGFNGRAVLIPVENGYILQSYYTNVAVYRNGEFFRLWNGYSNTTLKHINAFRSFVGLNTISKREWIEMEVE